LSGNSGGLRPQPPPNEKIRFYRMARRSATECAGILDICRDLDLMDEEISMIARSVLLRVVAMLTKMARVSSQAQEGAQALT
jgi:four helix bundle protein